MKIVFIAFLFVANAAFSQTTVKSKDSRKNIVKIVTEISKLIKTNSLFADSLNWVVIKEEVQNISREINSVEGYQAIYKFFTQQLRNAGDNHSFFLTTDNVTKIKNPIAAADQAEGKYLEDGMGYIKVPRCLNLDAGKDRDFANTIRYQIKKIDTENNITSWVVDLRHNTGGNMWPMLAGLNALIEDGTAGYFVTTKGECAWKNKNGELLNSKEIIDNYKIKNQGIRIAVLIDSRTASSGEMTAVSFSGLPNVKFFGTPSAGYTTANKTFNLSNGTQLYLASSYIADRNHKAFINKIIPDVVVELNDDSEDKILTTAMQWLQATK